MKEALEPSHQEQWELVWVGSVHLVRAGANLERGHTENYRAVVVGGTVAVGASLVRELLFSQLPAMALPPPFVVT